MNYGKKSAAKKQRVITSKSTMKKKRRGVRALKVILVTFLILFVAGGVTGGLFLKKIIDDAPDITPASVKPEGFASIVYNQDNEEIQRFVESGSNRIYKTIDEIPKDLQNAFVAIEDSRFYSHNGVDLHGILRAAFVGITQGNFSEGASTITQQLIKNNVFPNFVDEQTFWDSLERKIQEQYLALKIEKQMSKEEILENYMNTINLGQNTLGVQSASMRYFNKDVSDLNLSECAAIAAITQNPGKYNPITNPEKNAERRHKVLNSMYEEGYISEEELNEALADDVYARIQTVNTEIQEESPYSYFIDALSNQVMDDLCEQLGYTETQAHNAVYSGGLSIFATQDAQMQKICDEELSNDSNYPSLKEVGLSYALTVKKSNGETINYSQADIKKYVKDIHGDKYGLVFSSEDKARAMIEEWKSTVVKDGDEVLGEVITLTPQPQASVVVMDQYTGHVKALTGGRGEKTSSRSYNRATESKRQPGSCFKILSTYAPALDVKDYTLATMIKDEPYSYKNGTPVKNWWGNSYKGNMSVRSAIEQSANIIAVKTLTDITPELGFEYLEKFGFSTLVRSDERQGEIFSDINQPLALGGLTDGVYNIEMTAAYAAIANGGVYTKPILYTKVLNHDGEVLLDNETNPTTKTVIKESTAALLTNAMEDVVTGSNGTGRRAKLDCGMPVSGKTGTTTSDVDIWFSGFTPYYTCSVWAGYDDNKPLTNSTFHLKIWKSIMDRIHKDLPHKDFEMPASVEKRNVCTITGELATSSCPSKTEYFATGTIPDTCSGHRSSNKNTNKKDSEKDDKKNGEENGSGSSSEQGPTTSGSGHSQNNTSGNPSSGNSQNNSENNNNTDSSGTGTH